MFTLDWKSFQIKLMRSLFLAASSVFVLLTSSALAGESTVENRAPKRLKKAAVNELSTTPLTGLADTVSLSSIIAESPKSAATPPIRVSPVRISRIDRQNTPAVDIRADSTPLETTPEPPTESTTEETVSAGDLSDACEHKLQVPSRFGAGYSTSSAGFDDILNVNAFVPLRQENCEDITFLEGSAQLHEDDFGFSLNVGHRDYDPDDDLINGGYLGVDSRSTEASTFYQLAAGYERIAKDWELRLNGYLPIGDTTRTIQDINTDTGIQSSSGFEGNQLMLSAVGERQRILQQENALGGFDVEIGTQLDDWYGGELMGYVGAYLLSGKESSLGGQARLMANFESNFNAGLSYQYDDIFGSSIGFSISATLPGTRFHNDGEHDFQEENEVVIRLRDPIVRRPNVAVNVVDDSEIISLDQTEALRNPEEEEEYRFVHVDLAGGTGTGDGTYENPFGAVEDAIALINGDADTYSDGNTIVYVDGESAPTATIPGFTIPDQVRVLSQGPEQIIAGMTFPGFPSTSTRLPFSDVQNFNVSSDAPNANGITVSLPDSNDGVFPTITGGADADLVTLGNNTVLSGFEISSAANHGVTGSNIDNVELRNNLIENAGGSGIALENVGGNAVLFDNVINGSADRGIQIQNSLTERPIEVAIAGFDLTNNQVGIEVVATGTVSEFPSQRVVIGPSTDANTSVGTPGGTALTNSIVGSTDEGIIVQATGSPTTLLTSDTQEVSISETTIEGSGAASGAAGLRVVTLDGAHSQEILVENSAITNSGGNGIEVVNGEDPLGATRTAAAQEVVIRDSTIANNGGNGIDVTLVDAGAQELVIRNNQILDNTGDGIRSIAQIVGVQEWRTDSTTGDAGISENTISGNDGQAIVIEVEDVATIPIASIVDNDLSDNNGAGPDIEITSRANPTSSAAACLIIRDNLAPQGIQLTGADPDPFLTGTPVPSVLVQDLAALSADPNITFITDNLLFGGAISTDAFAEESNNCIP
ncbi:MAG: right-handed parallel beta-helix repeat-containing protein [Cyanobacteria bacterium J06632_3]